MIKIGDEKFYSPLSQNPIFMQKGGGGPPKSTKIQPSPIQFKVINHLVGLVEVSALGIQKRSQITIAILTLIFC